MELVGNQFSDQNSTTKTFRSSMVDRVGYPWQMLDQERVFEDAKIFDFFLNSYKNPEKILMEVNSLFAHQKLLGWMENMLSLEKVKHSYIYKDEKSELSSLGDGYC